MTESQPAFIDTCRGVQKSSVLFVERLRSNVQDSRTGAFTSATVPAVIMPCKSRGEVTDIQPLVFLGCSREILVGLVFDRIGRVEFFQNHFQVQEVNIVGKACRKQQDRKRSKGNRDELHGTTCTPV